MPIYHEIVPQEPGSSRDSPIHAVELGTALPTRNLARLNHVAHSHGHENSHGDADDDGTEVDEYFD